MSNFYFERFEEECGIADYTVVMPDDGMGPRIACGDTVLVREQEEYQNGDVVAYILGDDLYIRRYHRITIENGKEYVTLMPTNDDYPIHVFEEGAAEVGYIVGRVVGFRSRI